MKTILALFLLLCSTFAALADTGASSEDATTAPKILAIGDSLMSWHTLTGLSIPNVVANELEEPTANRSIGCARLLFKIPFIGDAGMQISNQIVDGDWDWVIMNGGGNDLWFGCGCSACDKKMDKLITEDGEAGEIPRVIDELREGGSKILYFGYLRSPGVDSLIDECREEGD
ncbi:MAG: SGNH/GDSL hydrolase family protein [Paracoccaceae bacterium]|nr:SGNH/GDSL hydrolase family protein [Paracoccaceae bacterium]